MTYRALSIIESIKYLIRIGLYAVIGSILISTILIYLWEEEIWSVNEPEFLSTFVWFSIMGGIWIIFLSIIFLIISAVIYKYKNVRIWDSVKAEIFLVLGSIFSFLILHLCSLAIQ